MALVDEKSNTSEHVKKVNEIYEQMQKDSSRLESISNQVKDLDRLEEENIPTISEKHFVHVFLPFFAGDEINTYNVNEGNWMTVAGSSLRGNAAFSRVNVIDDNGQVLFSVPPLFDNRAIVPGEHKPQNSVREVFEEYKYESQIAPAVAMSNYRLKLANMLANNSKDVRDLAIGYIAQWNEIFKRYKRPEIELKDENGNPLIATKDGKLQSISEVSNNDSDSKLPGLTEDDFEEI